MTLYERFPELVPERVSIESTILTITEMYQNNGKLLLCGNGGSAADCDHIAGELLKSFTAKRKMTDAEAASFQKALGADAEQFVAHLQRGVPAISLAAQAGVFTAYCNDVEPSMVYAQLTFALGRTKDVLFVISTSGNSANVVNAVMAAKALGIRTVGLTGRTGGKLHALCDLTICAPASETYRVQEYHLPIYHHICLQVERLLFGL